MDAVFWLVLLVYVCVASAIGWVFYGSGYTDGYEKGYRAGERGDRDS